MNRWRIAAIGEVLWDIFPTGRRFGGAPANFACACAALAGKNASVSMVSAVGRDDLGKQAVASLDEKSVLTKDVVFVDQQTGRVDISLDDSGSATYDFAKDCAWDNLAWSDELSELASKLDAVCFGTLGQRSPTSRAVIQRFLQSTPETSLRIFDINLRAPFYSEKIVRESLSLANVLKLNDEELKYLADAFRLTGSNVEVIEGLARTYELHTVTLTRGKDGALIWSRGVASQANAVASEVVDTVGAGDAFTAALAIGLLGDANLDDINRSACKIAAYVCSQPGATPSFPDELTASSR